MDLRSHAIITGGSSGIGRATARLLTRHGAHVSIVARRQELLDETLAELEDWRGSQAQRLRAHAADVADWEQTQEAIAALTADGYPPDILINAAGVSRPGYFEELSPEIFRHLMDVDFFGTLYPIKAVLPSMIERHSGHIVTFSSIAGFVGVFGYTAYSAPKFAVRGLSDALRQEMKLYGIYVSTVFPPNTDTPGLEYENRFKPPETHRVEGQAKTLSADQVAQAVVRGIERRKAYILPGLDTRFYFLLANGAVAIPFFRWFFFDRIIARARRERDAPDSRSRADKFA